ncbi:MAG: hypothetical protein ABSC91_09340 [Candidatus Bathyarchaeia archaeon]|jgi:hypothetical protein
MKKAPRRKKASIVSVSEISIEENRGQKAVDATKKTGLSAEQKKKEANEPLYLIRYE